MTMKMNVIIILAVICSITFWSQIEARTFVVALQHEAKTMDPHDRSDYTGFLIRDNMYDGLTRYQGNPPELEPWLAKSWEIGSDGKTYTFNLRRGVLFHDGSEMTSEDVVFSVDKLLRGGKGAAGTLIKFMEIGCATAPDKYTVIIS